MRLGAASLPALFEEAGRALAETFGATLPARPDRPPRRVRVEARDLEALMVEWVNELVFQSERSGEVFVETKVELLSDQALEAELFGLYQPSVKTQVKAATFHGLSVRQEAGRYVATVVLDV